MRLIYFISSNFYTYFLMYYLAEVDVTIKKLFETLLLIFFYQRFYIYRFIELCLATLLLRSCKMIDIKILYKYLFYFLFIL